jgi:hypothetical protein
MSKRTISVESKNNNLSLQHPEHNTYNIYQNKRIDDVYTKYTIKYTNSEMEFNHYINANVMMRQKYLFISLVLNQINHNKNECIVPVYPELSNLDCECMIYPFIVMAGINKQYYDDNTAPYYKLEWSNSDKILKYLQTSNFENSSIYI